MERLGLPFIAVAPGGDEEGVPGESGGQMVRRLAEKKARSVVNDFPDGVIIGSDQVAVIDGRVLGKPGNFVNAAAQLRLASGREVVFLTGLCLLSPQAPELQSAVIEFRVLFRMLTDAVIHRYLEREEPYDCAGGFKSEGLGIALFARMSGEDPTALIGLPLIALTGMLERVGISVI